MSDDVLEHARRAWLPRLVATGIPLRDYRETTERIDRWEDWCASWVTMGEVHEALADEAVGRLSRAEHLRTAALSYHFGQFLFVHHPDEMQATHERAVEVGRRAVELMDPPGEHLTIPYGDANLFGILRVPTSPSDPDDAVGSATAAVAGSAAAAVAVDGAKPSRRPLVILACGLDAAKEELRAYETALLERGMATLALEGPGQGEAQYTLAVDPAFETAVTAALDALDGDPRLDLDAVGMFGISMLGGLYTLRAAAHVDRIRACVTIASAYDFSDGWDTRAWLSREAFRIRARLDTLDEAHAYAREFTLAGVAEQVTCPVFLAHGTADRMCPPSALERLAAEVSGEVTTRLVEGGAYVLHDLPYQYRPQSADWLTAQLGGTLS